MENQAEITAITDAIENYYFKGIYEGDALLLGSIFHPGILLFGDIKGQSYFKTIDLYLDGVKNRQSPKDLGKPFERGNFKHKSHQFYCCGRCECKNV